MQKDFEILMQQYDFMEKRYEELTKYFCIDKKTSMEEVFGDLAHFSKDFEVQYTHGHVNCGSSSWMSMCQICCEYCTS